MKFRHLALSNVKGNWHRYIAFYLSCTFSVMIFYIFASFIYHPDVVHGHIRGGANVRAGLIACEYMIMIFSFFFVLYSESAFIKSRKKEFGLFSLFGMTRGQIRKLVFYENTLIALLSIFSGLVIGTVFSKLFLMAMSSMLHVNTPIHFEIVPKAVIITVIGFLAVFVFITLLLLFGVGRSEIIDLLKASRKPKSLPVFSKWLVTLAAVTLVAGYAMAYFSNTSTLALFMFPVLGLVVLGTYFLFTQGSVAIFRRLQKNRSIYYKRTNLITLSQLIFKMKDNARVLFMVAVLSAVVMTASGTFYILFQGTTSNVVSNYPHTFSFVEQGVNTHKVIDPSKVNQILKQNGVQVKNQFKITGVPATVSAGGGSKENRSVLLISESTYKHVAGKMDNFPQVNVPEGKAAYFYNGPETMRKFNKGQQVHLAIGKKDFSVRVDNTKNKMIYNQYLLYSKSVTSGLLVMNDNQYQRFAGAVPAGKKLAIYAYDLKNWASTQGTIKNIKSHISKPEMEFFTSRVEPYLAVKQFSSLTMFIGIFVSLLFFIASGSMIYFKLFTELQEDQVQFESLRRIGITEREIRKIVTRQIAMIFFVPFIVGAVHALFAFKMLQNMNLFSGVWVYGGIVIGIFFVMQLIYFFITRQTYMRQIVKS